MALQLSAAGVNFPTTIFLSLALGEQYDETQDWTKLLTTGVLAVQPGILQRHLLGLDEVEEFLFVFFSFWIPAPVGRFFFIYHQVEIDRGKTNNNPVDLIY